MHDESPPPKKIHAFLINWLSKSGQISTISYHWAKFA